MEHIVIVRLVKAVFLFFLFLQFVIFKCSIYLHNMYYINFSDVLLNATQFTLENFHK